MEKLKALNMEELENVSGGSELESNNENKNLLNEFKTAWNSLGLKNDEIAIRNEYKKWAQNNFTPDAYNYLQSLTH